MTTLNEVVLSLAARFSENHNDAWFERAAIREFEAGLPRDEAQLWALLDVVQQDPMAMSGVFVLKAELDGDTRYIVTTDLQAANQHLVSLGYVITETDLSSVLDSEFGGTASLEALHSPRDTT